MDKASLRLAFCFISLTFAWDSDDISIYDLVEEINRNFYEIFGVDQEAPVAEIRRAYRRLSLQFHPDKNKEEGSEDKFRQIAAIYEILKDDSKRQKYNEVLLHGLPDWKQPVFYYRRARKITLFELFILLLGIGVVGQYLVLWAMFFEKRLSLEDLFSSKRRRKKKEGIDPQEEFKQKLADLPRPKFKDLYPWQLSCLMLHLICSFPSYCQSFAEYIKAERERIKLKRDIEPLVESDIEYVKKPKKRQKVTLPEYQFDDTASSTVSYLEDSRCTDEQQIKTVKTGDWTVNEISLLTKAIAKFPGGTQDRWTKVAEFVGRSIEDVMVKRHEMQSQQSFNISPDFQGTTGVEEKPVSFKKGQSISDTIKSESYSGYRSMDDDYQHSDLSLLSTLSTSECKIDSNLSVKLTSHELNIKSPKSTEDEHGRGKVWSQTQQAVLEWALKNYPKTCDNRWEKIASHISEMTADDCIQRYKFIAMKLKEKQVLKSSNL